VGQFQRTEEDRSFNSRKVPLHIRLFNKEGIESLVACGAMKRSDQQSDAIQDQKAGRELRHE
jgi:hypothetical protein